jgi:hypothetical protein
MVRNVLNTGAPALPVRLPGQVVLSRGGLVALGRGRLLALGRGGIGNWIVHLIIWHEIFRLLRYVWHIHTFGPFLVILIIAILIGLAVWQRQRGFRRRRGPGGGSAGTGTGPRDW